MILGKLASNEIVLQEKGWKRRFNFTAFDNIYRKLNDKAGQYSKLAKRADAPYVLVIYGEFAASIAPREVQHVLFAQHGGWFTRNPEIAGLIYCRSKELPFEFQFTYYANQTQSVRPLCYLRLLPMAGHNPSIKRTSQRLLRAFCAAAHVER